MFRQIKIEIMNTSKVEARKYSFYFSILYVGIGTLAELSSTTSIFNENEFIEIILLIIMLITMPVCFISFGILYGEGSGAWLAVLIVQVAVFFVVWYLSYRYLLRRYSRREPLLDKDHDHPNPM